MAAYLSQAEAATYLDPIGTWSSSQAVAYLSSASNMVDQYCQRTFAATDLTADVKLAICILANYLKTTATSAGVILSEKVGDYSVSYQTSGSNLPENVEQILQPYRVMVMG